MPTSLRIRNGRSRASPASALLWWLTTLVGFPTSLDAASAKDLRTVADFVVPAYTAMQFTMLCSHDNPQFILQTIGARGTALEYAEHVKNEAITSLTYNEAATVLKMAADEARSVARRELRKLANRGEITNWCHSEAKTFVLTFIQQHDERHETLLNELEKAKQ